MSDLTNQVIGDYRLEALIGPTETGDVYRARHLTQNQLYALKVVHPALAQEPSFRAAFRQQSALVRTLRHPHIVDVVESSVRDGLCYMVMEWLPDGTLRDLLQRRATPDAAWSLALGLDLVRQAAEALDFAHTQGFVHGSIKPSDLLLVSQRAGFRYAVKLADFGLAWLAIHSETAAAAVWADSLIYAMAPERCQGLDVDGRADVYALGVILYEIATGSPPFEAKTLDAAVYRHVYTAPTPPRQLTPDLPPALETIILRCLAKAPADRFAHAAELASALREVVQALPAPPEDPAMLPEGISVDDAIDEDAAVRRLVTLALAPPSDALPDRAATPDRPTQLTAPTVTATLPVSLAESARLPAVLPAYAPEELIDRTLGDYRIEAYLGESETGYVYRAQHLLHAQPAYALKVVYATLAQEPSFWQGFNQLETRISALRHPHIVDVAEIGVRDQLCYVVTEWLPDGTLRNLLQRRANPDAAWSLALALDLVRQAAEALDFAHTQGFVHGSIKPNNLLLIQHKNGRAGVSYTVKVADFGLAWLAIHSETAAAAVWADSLIYAMAPERCQGLDVDGRADVYALGVILYEIATGSPPFEAKTLDAAVYRHVYTTPTPPRQLAPNLPLALEAIILRCLAKAPADRFAHAADLAAALQAILLSPALAPRLPITANAIAAPATHTVIGAVTAPHVNALDQYGRTLEARALTGDGLSIGRAPDNDLVLDAPAIAARHLLVDWDGQAALVTNLSGSNNVMIGDTTLAADATHSWNWDEPIRLGPFWLRLESAPPDGTPAPKVAVAQSQAFTSGMESEAVAPTVDTVRIAPIAPIIAHQSAPVELLTDRIGIVLDQPMLTITPGRVATFRLTLANLGNLVDHLTVTVEQVPPGWVAGPPPVLQLNPGVQGLVTLHINVPQMPESRAGAYPIIIRARSRENPHQSNTMQALWTVLPFESNTFDLKPKRIRRRLRGTYRLIVRNMGNAPARYQLSASDDEETLGYLFAEEQVQLEPGASAKLNLVVRPNRVRWFGISQQHRFTVQAKPDGDAEPQTVSAQFEQAAVISRWMIVVAVLLLLGGLAGLWLWYRPNISTLSSDPPAPVLGQPFIISWQVTNAPTVELRVNGTAVVIPPNTSRQIFSGFESPPDIRLIARNVVYGQDSRSLLVNMVSPTPTATPIPTLRPTATPTLVPIPPTPTATPVPSPTPVLPTGTPAPTNTPISQTLCRASDFTTLRGEGPPLTPFLVYIDARAVGGGTTDRNGQFSVILGRINESPGAHAVVVRNRNTREILRAVTCIVP